MFGLAYLAFIALYSSFTLSVPTVAFNQSLPFKRYKNVHYRHDIISGSGDSSRAKLNYYGGPVLNNVQVTPLVWGDKVNYWYQVSQFYKAITSSSLFDWRTLD
jgi:hypothetical protein